MTTKRLRLASLLALLLVLLATTVSAPAVRSPLVAAQLDLIRPPPGAVLETRAVRRLDRISEQAHVAVSALDEKSGERFDHGSGRFETASLVKIHLVALMSWRAAKNDVRLSAAQRRDATLMLVRSDNEAALRTYFTLGGRPGIERGLASAFGASGIRIGDLGYWGHSVTTPHDVVTLLDRVLDPDAAATYGLLQDAMTRVIPVQRWGISVLADDGSTVRTKVGWVEDPDGWIVNSSGRVLVDGAPVLISVMSDRNSSMEAGVETVEHVAAIVGDVVRARRTEAGSGSIDAPSRGACFVPVPPVSAC